MKKILGKIVNRLDKFSRKTAKLDLKYLIKSGGWRISENFSGILASFLISVAFANLLPVKDFGIYKYLLSIAGVMTFLTFNGIGIAVTQAVAKGYDAALIAAIRFQQRWNLIYVASLLAIAGYYFYKSNYLFAISLAVLAFTIPLTSIYSTYTSFLLGKKEFKEAALYSLVKNIIRLVITITVLIITKSIFALIITSALVLLLPNMFFYKRTLDKFSVPSKTDPSKDKDLFVFGLHRSLIGVVSTLASYIDSILVFQLIGPIQLAIYSFAQSIPDVGKGIIKNIISIYFPKLANRSLNTIRSVFLLRMVQSMVAGAIFSIAMIIITPPVFQFVFPRYIDSIFYAQLMALAFVFMVPNTYIAYILNSQKMVSSIYLVSVSTSVIRITSIVSLGFIFGVIGIIIGKLIGDFFGLLIGYITIQKTSRS